MVGGSVGHAVYPAVMGVVFGGLLISNRAHREKRRQHDRQL
ncbi:hypothetical protein ACFVGN_19720 [Streptomyces sp. NPDC057757]